MSTNKKIKDTCHRERESWAGETSWKVMVQMKGKGLDHNLHSGQKEGGKYRDTILETE